MPQANTAPLAVGTIKSGQVVVAAANANRNGTGTLATDIFALYTAGTSGAVIARVRATHQGANAVASTAMSCRLYRVNSGATVKTLISEVLLPSATPTAGTVLGATATFPVTNITLASGEALWVSQSAAESVAYDADQGGDY